MLVCSQSQPSFMNLNVIKKEREHMNTDEYQSISVFLDVNEYIKIIWNKADENKSNMLSSLIFWVFLHIACSVIHITNTDIV